MLFRNLFIGRPSYMYSSVSCVHSVALYMNLKYEFSKIPHINIIVT